MANTTLRSVREAMLLSQEEFAERIRAAGDQLREPNDCTTRTVQRWEAGNTSYPRRTMLRALEHVTGERIQDLGFDYVPRVGKLSDHTETDVPEPPRPVDDVRTVAPIRFNGTLTGIWESRSEYRSGSRDETYVDLAYLVVIHHADTITARSIAGSGTDGSKTSMTLAVRGAVVTGTWEQVTGEDSYYRGQTFHGAIQMHVDPAGGRMKGTWVGIGRDFDANTGPWELILRERGTAKVEDYARVPNGA